MGDLIVGNWSGRMRSFVSRPWFATFPQNCVLIHFRVTIQSQNVINLWVDNHTLCDDLHSFLIRHGKVSYRGYKGTLGDWHECVSRCLGGYTRACVSRCLGGWTRACVSRCLWVKGTQSTGLCCLVYGWFEQNGWCMCSANLNPS